MNQSAEKVQRSIPIAWCDLRPLFPIPAILEIRRWAEWRIWNPRPPVPLLMRYHPRYTSDPADRGASLEARIPGLYIDGNPLEAASASSSIDGAAQTVAQANELAVDGVGISPPAGRRLARNSGSSSDVLRATASSPVRLVLSAASPAACVGGRRCVADLHARPRASSFCTPFDL